VGASTALAVVLLFSVVGARGEGSAAAAPPVPTSTTAAQAPAPSAASAPAAASGAPVAAAAAGKPEDTPAGQLFGSRCTACHNIGEGRKVGPDLLGVTDRRKPEWITLFLTSPGKAIDSGDPIATQLFKEANGVRMPEQDLKPEQITQLLEFFSLCTKKGGCKPGPAIKLGIDGSEGEVQFGKDLALGLQRLSGGGPACTECHHFRGVGLLGGGNVGPDLTTSWGRLHDAGWAEKLLASPLEKKVYEGKDLTDAEKFALRAYFATLSKDGTRDPLGGDFFDLGALGALALLGFIGVTWAGRNGEKA
jgi:mono/diheme cytochrome c family protein